LARAIQSFAAGGIHGAPRVPRSVGRGRGDAAARLALDPWPITAGPDNFVIVVAGGAHPTNSYWLQGYSPGVVGRPIELPPSFDTLLDDAERDLGPR